MKSFYQIILVVILVGPICGFGAEGQEKGGGDGTAKLFSDHLKSLAHLLRAHPELNADRIDLYVFEKKAVSAEVSSTINQIFAYNPSTGKTEPVEATNEPSTNTILFNGPAFTSWDQVTKDMLGLHEVFGLMKLETTKDYHLSMPLAKRMHDDYSYAIPTKIVLEFAASPPFPIGTPSEEQQVWFAIPREVQLYVDVNRDENFCSQTKSNGECKHNSPADQDEYHRLSVLKMKNKVSEELGGYQYMGRIAVTMPANKISGTRFLLEVPGAKGMNWRFRIYSQDRSDVLFEHISQKAFPQEDYLAEQVRTAVSE